MKKGDIFEGKVIRTEFPNKGIIDIEGQKVIVKNALEGQVVRFSINNTKRDKIEGRLLEVIEPSPIEQQPANISVSAVAAVIRTFLMSSSLI